MIQDIHWQLKIETGITQIDDEHRVLVSVYNEILAEFRSGSSQVQLLRGIRAIIRQTQEHFESEEKIMDVSEYPYLPCHSKEHKDLVDRLNRLVVVISDGRQEVDEMVLSFVKEWLVNHILESDVRFGDYVAEQETFQSGALPA